MERYDISVDYERTEQGYWVRHDDHLAAVERLTEALDAARGALADIANSDDMTLELARTKAARIYAETELSS